MPGLRRIVIDPNVLISRLLLPQSTPAQAVRKATREGQPLVSEDTMNELADVLSRRKLDPYVNLEERKQFLRDLAAIVEFVPIISRVYECRDPEDDKFLEVALNGRAELIVTGDRNLLRMSLWRGIEILTPAAYIRKET